MALLKGFCSLSSSAHHKICNIQLLISTLFSALVWNLFACWRQTLMVVPVASCLWGDTCPCEDRCDSSVPSMGLLVSLCPTALVNRKLAPFALKSDFTLEFYISHLLGLVKLTGRQKISPCCFHLFCKIQEMNPNYGVTWGLQRACKNFKNWLQKKLLVCFQIQVLCFISSRFVWFLTFHYVCLFNQEVTWLSRLHFVPSNATELPIIH